MTKLGLYSRCSTADQSLDVQREALRRYAANRGAEGIEFSDFAVSGAKDRRPALDRMLTAARRREVSAVVVTKLDRLARSVRHLTTLAAELESLNVSLVVLDQALDSGTPSGRLLFNVLASIAEFERDLIRERIAQGVARARDQGRCPGRPRTVTGEALARARRLRASGRSIREIATLVGASKSALARALHS